MEKRVVRLSDKIQTPDRLNANGLAANFDTSVIIRARNIHRDGDSSIMVKQNKTVLPGRLKLLEDNFPIDINMDQHLFLNDNVLGTTDLVTGQNLNPIVLNPANGIRPKDNVNLYKQRNVQWWCAGNGARNRTISNSFYDSHATDTKLFHMIPFRIIEVSDNLPDEERKEYKFEVIFGPNSDYYGYKAYYFKKIKFNMTSDYNGVHMNVDGEDYTTKLSWADTVPDLDGETPPEARANQFKGNRTQHNFIDMGMSVTSKEFKEWFELINGSTADASISELGLIAGLECVRGKGNEPISALPLADQEAQSLLSEVYDADLFAHLCFETYTVARENAQIDFEYRIYA